MSGDVRARVLAALDDPRRRMNLLRALDDDVPRAAHFADAPEPTMRNLIDRRHTEIEEEHEEYLAATGQDEAVQSDHRVNPDDVIERIAVYEGIRRDQAAYRLQTTFRMKLFGRMREFGEDTTAIIKALGLDEGAALERPSLDISIETAREMLPHTENGELFSYSEGLEAFDQFGVEVACYTRFITYTGRVFWACLLYTSDAADE